MAPTEYAVGFQERPRNGYLSFTVAPLDSIFICLKRGGALLASRKPLYVPCEKAAWLVEDSHARNCPFTCSRGILSLDKYKFPAEVGHLEFPVVASIDDALWMREVSVLPSQDVPTRPNL